MKHSKLMRAMWWVAGLMLLTWMLGMMPVAPAPVDRAWAGFFDKVKKGSDDTPAPSNEKKESGSSESKGGGFSSEVKEKPSAPPPAPQPKSDSGGFFSEVKEKPAPAPPAPQSAPAPQPKSDSGGFFGEVKQKPAEPSQPAPPPQFSPAPQPKPDTGGFFNPTQDRPRQSTIIVPGTTRPSRPGEYRPQVRREGWVGGQAALEKVKSPPQHGWTGRGYFEQLRHEREARRRPDLYIQLWYYPYDYAFYCWQRYHYEPWYIWPYYTYAYPGYQYFYYYYAAPPTIILQEAFDSVYGETYVPYVTWPSNSLMEAKRDLEQAWRQERIELLERHLDPDHAIASYFRDEYTHGMSAEEFRQLTLDAFSAIRTVTFALTSARYVSTREWARLQGTHIFYDPYDERTVVDVSYLLHRSESETGRLRWVIWEVRQSPHAD